MVKVEEKSLEERAREEKISTLVKVTDELLGKGSAENGLTSFDIFVGELHVDILCGHRINVPEEKYFDTAMKLAEAYEAATGKEWTVKKNY